MEKSEIRKLVLAKRDAMSRTETREKSRMIQERLVALPEFRKASAIMFYVQKGNEVMTDTIIEYSLGEGKRVAVPFSDKRSKTLVPSLISSLSELEMGSFGIPEPRELHPIEAEAIELIIVPGIAFDRSGNRIGYGHGYYDRFLKTTKTKKIALAYELQIVDEIPNHSNDIKMDKIVTEERVIEPR